MANRPPVSAAISGAAGSFPDHVQTARIAWMPPAGQILKNPQRGKIHFADIAVIPMAGAKSLRLVRQTDTMDNLV